MPQQHLQSAQAIRRRLVEWQTRFPTQMMGDDDSRRDHQSDWKEIVADLYSLSKQGLLDDATRNLAYVVARNITMLCERLKISDVVDSEVAKVVDKIEALMVSEHSRKRRHDDHDPRPKRYCRRSSERPATPLECDPLPAPKPPKSSRPPPPPGDHSVVRLWFLNNLSYPYPTSSQKETLAAAAGIARSKVDSDLTNFRRRAGWTNILNKWADGNREKMRRLMERVASGEEKRQEVLKAVEKCEDYLTEKETKRVGDWVNEIAKATATETDASTVSTKQRAQSISGISLTSSLLTNDPLRSSTPRSFSGSSAAFSDVSDLVPISAAPPPKRRMTEDAISPFKRARKISSSSSSSAAEKESWSSFFPNQQKAATPNPASSTGLGFHIGTAYREYSPKKRHTFPEHKVYAMPPPAYSAAAPTGSPSSQGSWSLPREWEFDPEIQWGEGQ
ncbi:hypothetical protein IAR50_002467 [Cryptococcus sp. DSM 104548]